MLMLMLIIFCWNWDISRVSQSKRALQGILHFSVVMKTWIFFKWHIVPCVNNTKILCFKTKKQKQNNYFKCASWSFNRVFFLFIFILGSFLRCRLACPKKTCLLVWPTIIHFSRQTTSRSLDVQPDHFSGFEWNAITLKQSLTQWSHCNRVWRNDHFETEFDAMITLKQSLTQWSHCNRVWRNGHIVTEFDAMVTL